VSRQQYGAGAHVSLKALRAADLLFYAKDSSDPRTIYHVGMYLGAGRMVEAPNPRAPVRIASMWRPGLIGRATRPASGLRGMLRVELGEAATPWPPSSSGWPPTASAWTSTASSAPRPPGPDGLPAGPRPGLRRVVGKGTWGALVTHGRQRSPARC
jgi:hypothetical protein